MKNLNSKDSTKSWQITEEQFNYCLSVLGRSNGTGQIWEKLNQFFFIGTAEEYKSEIVDRCKDWMDEGNIFHKI